MTDSSDESEVETSEPPLKKICRIPPVESRIKFIANSFSTSARDSKERSEAEIRIALSECAEKIADIVKPKNLKAELAIIYQTVENLNKACPNDTGDWYFTGNYPTPGGNKVVNTAFVNFMKGVEIRAY